LQTNSGQKIVVPGTLASMTAYVVLEQENWFEGEIGFIGRLLVEGQDALDIGANHGVYTLALARATAQGHVWAFEPTAAPRDRLERTVQANALQGRVTVVPCGLSDHAGSAVFNTSEHSELNSLHAHGGTVCEQVRMDTLDAFAQRHLQCSTVGLVKIDAEGEEPRVLAGGSEFFKQRSPVVMFEMVAGNRPQRGLVEQFAAMGYRAFRHLPELDLLIEYQARGDEEDAFVLNLFALKPDQQDRLARAGLLVRWADLSAQDEVIDPDPAALQWLAEMLPMHGLGTAASEQRGEDFAAALAHAASAHMPRCSAPRRVLHMLAARERIEAALADGRVAHPAAWLLLVHGLQALGQRQAAILLASQLLVKWPKDAQIDDPFMPPLAADLQRARSTSAASWAHQTLGEFLERHGRYSSFFGEYSPALRRLLDHPDHSAEMERRYVLQQSRNGQPVDARALRRLQGETKAPNRAIWAAWLDEAVREATPCEA
jgi:FkbM family methyltransferase